MRLRDLREILSYDPDTGEITWRVDGIKRRAGEAAGSVNKLGYVQITVRPKNYLGHRLAWALHHGSWPTGQIDHINHDRSDNRLQNLRVVDNRGNSKNRPQQSNNRSGVTGVSWDRVNQKWVARIRVPGGSYKNLGRFNDLQAAAAARKNAEAQFGFHRNHGAVR